GVGIATCLLIAPIAVVFQGFFSGASQTAAHTRPPGLATRANSFTLTSISGKNMKPNLHNTASNELSGKGRAPASHCLVRKFLMPRRAAFSAATPSILSGKIGNCDHPFGDESRGSDPLVLHMAF